MAGREGQQFGPYRLLHLIGTGGFSEVYLGEHTYLGSQAAVKLINAFLGTGAIERFLAEARTLSQLTHPHIIRLLDFGVENAVPYLVMEYAPGGTLRQRHPRGQPVPLATLVPYVQQVTSALQYAHDHQVIHCDLKPENLLIGKQGEVLLSDFGLALIKEQGTEYLNPSALESTMSYMAPELFRGKAGNRSDQYALGITIYEWLTGECPFSGQAPELCYQHVHVPPPPLSPKIVGLPPLVEQVVFTALAKESKQRFANVQTFALAFELACKDVPSQELHLLFPSPVVVETQTPSPLALKSRQTSSLLTPLSSLIGREQERPILALLLLQPAIRLLTLTGTGGVGKTHLALAVAHDLRESFSDGVCFISLASLTDAEMVLPTICGTLGVKRNNGQSLLDLLADALNGKQMLLVLDNFEQVNSAARSLADLLSRCPEMKLFVTSRIRLTVQGEQIYPLSPLALPEPDQALELLARNAAVALFVDRAKAVKPDFRLEESNARTIAQICMRLDGLPLAIELAAARIRLLPPRALLPRLSSRLSVLTGGSQNLPERQQTLRNTIAWSYDLLTIAEQRLFLQLSLFVGGCTLSALEALSSGSGENESSLLERIGSLIDKHLIRQQEQDVEEPRLLMLETIREFGLEMLSRNQEQAQIKRAYALYYFQVAFDCAQKLKGVEQEYWLNQLERDLDNLRATLRWFLETDRVRALEMATALMYFLGIHHPMEGYFWLNEALEQSRQESIPLSLRADALDSAGTLAHVVGNYEQAETFCKESVQIYRQLGNMRGVADSLYVLALIAWENNDLGAGETIAQECLQLSGQTGYHWIAVNALHLLITLAMRRGEYSRARSMGQEARALAQVQESSFLLLHVQCLLARIDIDQGNYQEARHQIEEALSQARALQDSYGITKALGCLVEIMLATPGERKQEVAILLQECLQQAREAGRRSLLFHALWQNAMFALQEGKMKDAHAFLYECQQLCLKEKQKMYALRLHIGLAQLALVEKKREEAHKWLVASRPLIDESYDYTSEIEYLELLAQYLMVEGEPKRATHFWGAAAALRESRGLHICSLVRPFHEQAVSAARKQVDEQSWHLAWNEGQQLPHLSVSAVLAVWGSLEASAQTKAAPTKRREHKQDSSASKAAALGITPREMDVLRLLAEGLTNKEIAQQLVLSTVTVNSYLRNLYSKLGVSSRTQAIRAATRHQIL